MSATSMEESRHRLFVFELRSMVEAMRKVKDPFAEPLQSAVNRFLLDASGDGPDPGEPAEEIQSDQAEPSA